MTWYSDDKKIVGVGLPEEVKPFPYWILLGLPLLMIPLIKKK